MDTLTEDATALLESVDASTPALPAKPDKSSCGNRLTRRQVKLILTLSDGDTPQRSQREIAQIVGCSQDTVSKVLRDYGDTRWLARRVLHNGSEQLAQRIIEKANPKVAVKVLEDLKVLVPPQQGPSTVQQNILVLGARALPADLSPPLDTLTVTPIPVSADPAEAKG